MLKGLLDYIYLDEEVCPLCMEEVRTASGPCYACMEKLDLVSFSEISDYTGLRLTYPLFYNAYLRDIIKRYKFQDETHLYKILGNFIYEEALKRGVFDRVDTLVPVPLYKRSLRQRGYNQSLLLAQYVQEKTGLDLRTDLVTKIRPTKEQKHLEGKKRLANLKGSMKVEDEIYGKKILLIDDIFTTGSTVKSIQNAMKKAPLHMEVLVIASSQRIEY